MSKTTYSDKIKRLEKLSKDDQQDLLFDLLSAFKAINTIDQVVLFIQDLLTNSEVKRLAKRLRIAKLLLEGETYEAIELELHTSHSTVAKVAIWLADKGEGFRSVIKRLPKRKDSQFRSILNDEWDQLKRNYSRYLWPEILLEEIIKSASKRKKAKLEKMIDSLKLKSDLHKNLKALLQDRS